MNNAAIGTETTWEADGIRYRELIRQEYAANDCVFSAGQVEGAGVDTMYIRWEKEGSADYTGMLLLRPDEVACIGWLCNGLLWSHHLNEVTEKED